MTQLEFAKESLEEMLLTDDELEQLIEFLQSKLTATKADRHALEEFKEFEQELKEDVVDSPEKLKRWFYDMEWHPDYYENYGEPQVERMNWDWIFQELNK